MNGSVFANGGDRAAGNADLGLDGNTMILERSL